MGPAQSTGALLIACCLSVAVGCSRPGPTRFSLTGTVSFKGHPVPAGRVVLVPDGDQGNRGPAAYAQIVGGHFATETRKGHVGGPHIVEIQGCETLVGTQAPRDLFPVHELVVDLPQADSTMDFQFPASAARRPAAPQP